MSDKIEQMPLPLPDLPEDINCLYNRETDPACASKSNLEEAAALQRELDGLATSLIQLEEAKRGLEDQLASARSICRAVESEIAKLIAGESAP